MLRLQGLVRVGDGKRALVDVTVGRWRLGPFSSLPVSLLREGKQDVAQDRIEGVRGGPRPFLIWCREPCSAARHEEKGMAVLAVGLAAPESDCSTAKPKHRG